MIANMRYIVSGLMLAAGLMWLLAYAAGDDSYYGGGVSRWDHAGRGGGQPLVVAAIVSLAVTLIAALLAALSSSARFRRLVLPLTAFSWVMLAVAWFVLTGGH